MLRPLQFRLVTVFAALSVLGCALAALQYWHRIPLASGSISHAICYAKDFEELVDSRPGRKAGDFNLHAFRVANIGELFRDFSRRPNLYPDRKGMSDIPSCNPLVTGFPCSF